MKRKLKNKRDANPGREMPYSKHKDENGQKRKQGKASFIIIIINKPQAFNDQFNQQYK